MLRIYYASHRNAVVTAETYLQRYPERQQPSLRFFQFMDTNLGEYGSFNKPRQNYGGRPNEHEQEILQAVKIHMIFITNT